MNTLDIFLQRLQILAAAKQEDLQNLFIQHGIVHLFQEQFELGITLLQEALREDGKGMEARGSPKEIIMAAYEEYVFIEEDVWLHMLQDCRRMPKEASLQPVVMRILMHYIPALQQVAKDLQQR